MIEDIRYAPIVGRTHIFFHWVYYLKHIINICLQFKTKNGCVNFKRKSKLRLSTSRCKSQEIL